MEAHDAIDHIEREIMEKYGVETTAHMDPIATEDEEVNRLREQVRELVKEVDGEMTIHDFRVTKGPFHTNLIFDVLVPHRCKLTDEEIVRQITSGYRRWTRPITLCFSWTGLTYRLTFTKYSP